MEDSILFPEILYESQTSSIAIEKLSKSKRRKLHKKAKIRLKVADLGAARKEISPTDQSSGAPPNPSLTQSQAEISVDCGRRCSALKQSSDAPPSQELTFGSNFSFGDGDSVTMIQGGFLAGRNSGPDRPPAIEEEKTAGIFDF